MKTAPWIALFGLALLVALPDATLAQDDAEEEEIDSSACVTCHEESNRGTSFADDLSHSSHDGFECLDCHQDKDVIPHRQDQEFAVGCEGCRACHDQASEEYTVHGREETQVCEDAPQCSSCHGDHEILPSRVKHSKTHPVNLPATCGVCHENVDLTRKYEILIDNPIEIYQGSVHGRATTGGIYVAATCNDCHSSGGSAHKIYSPGHQESAINHFNIPDTCGKCHQGVAADFWEGIHGQLVKRGETDAPVCTHCHGEHGITSPDDPRSPVSSSHVAQQTCSPCHESAVLNEKYGLSSGRLTSFIDSYHGLKSRAGDTHVANCASCHGVHRILPSSNPTSTIYPANLQVTCGECHPGISETMAAQPIHGVSGEGLRTKAADIVANIYLIIIIGVIGLMLLHWALDLGRHLRDLMTSRPQVLRMTSGEIWQHTFLMVTFVVLVVSGFALRFAESWLTRLFFGWEGGFQWRGTVHRFAAVFFIITVIWHTIYLFATTRGRAFIHEMLPVRRDFRQFWRRILYNLGRRSRAPRFGKFSYVEKAEYWALIWGSAIMVITGLLLWFDNWFVQFLPKGILDVTLVVHYYEAWLATLAILVWHLYSTVFSPHVYPMNPSWITGRMPEEMYRHEHPEDLENAKEETRRQIHKQLERLNAAPEEEEEEEEEPPQAPPGSAA